METILVYFDLLPCDETVYRHSQQQRAIKVNEGAGNGEVVAALVEAMADPSDLCDMTRTDIGRRAQ